MQRLHPMPTNDAWPPASKIANVRDNLLYLGSPTLDAGLQVTWGNNPAYWAQVDEPTSPRGRIWRLNMVCWVSVITTVPAPKPGLYAAFFKIRKYDIRSNLLSFSAEWKANAAGTTKQGFLHTNGSPTSGSFTLQESDAIASWSHRRLYTSVDPGAWMLLHVGNVVVRRRAHALDGGTEADDDGLEVVLSFGGDNPYWCSNLDVDFAAIAPLRLCWDITRVIWIGQMKGKSSVDGVTQGANNGDEEDVHPQGGISPLYQVSKRLIRLILEFSQPTLTQAFDGNSSEPEGDEGKDDSGTWRVF